MCTKYFNYKKIPDSFQEDIQKALIYQYLVFYLIDFIISLFIQAL